MKVSENLFCINLWAVKSWAFRTTFPELNRLLAGVTISEGGVLPHIHPQLLPIVKKRRLQDSDDEREAPTGVKGKGGKGKGAGKTAKKTVKPAAAASKPAPRIGIKTAAKSTTKSKPSATPTTKNTAKRTGAPTAVKVEKRTASAEIDSEEEVEKIVTVGDSDDSDWAQNLVRGWRNSPCLVLYSIQWVTFLLVLSM